MSERSQIRKWPDEVREFPQTPIWNKNNKLIEIRALVLTFLFVRQNMVRKLMVMWYSRACQAARKRFLRWSECISWSNGNKSPSVRIFWLPLRSKVFSHQKTLRLNTPAVSSGPYSSSADFKTNVLGQDSSNNNDALNARLAESNCLSVGVYPRSKRVRNWIESLVIDASKYRVRRVDGRNVLWCSRRIRTTIARALRKPVIAAPTATGVIGCLFQRTRHAICIPSIAMETAYRRLETFNFNRDEDTCRFQDVYCTMILFTRKFMKPEESEWKIE